MASQPLPYRPHTLAKNERNRAMISDYLSGMSRTAVAEKYGISRHRLNKKFWQQRVLLSPEERSRRTKSPAARKSPGRPPVWPDCPPHLAEDYALFRRKGLRAAEARAMLDPEFQA
jgi:hypothetical protein